MKRFFLAMTACVCLGLTGCATRQIEYPVNNPEMRSILIVPVVNETHEVLAGNLMLSTMSWPLAERGYYTFPINTVKFICEQEGWYEPEQVHQLEPKKLAEMFDADAVLYARVKFWDATYMVFSTRTQITVDYYLYDREGQQLLTQQLTQYYQPSNNADSGLAGLIVDAVVAAIHRAAPDYKPLANAINARFITNFAPGPYLIEAGQKNNQPQ